MKSSYVKTIAFFLCIANGYMIQAQTSDYALVEQCITHYLVGDTNKDFETLKPAFHPKASMKYISESAGYQEYNALEVFAGDKGRDPEKDRIDHIAYISVTGNAAHAKIEVAYPKTTIVDYIQLLKIDGTWRIVSKVFSRKPNAR